MKKNLCRALALVLVVVLTFVLCSCFGKDKGDGNKGGVVGGNTGTSDKVGAWYLGGGDMLSKVDPEEVFADKNDTVNPATIYAAADITEEMIHGVYALNNINKDVKDVRKNTPFEDVQFHNGTFSISVLPVTVSFGVENVSSSLNKYDYSEFGDFTEFEIASLQFATADDIGSVLCQYELDGNKIVFKQIRSTSEMDAELEYEFTGVEFTYDYKIAGPYITLTKGEASLTLTAYCFTDNTDAELWLNGYSLYDSPLIDELDYFSSADAWNYAVRRDGSYYDVSAFKFDEEGRASVYLAEKSYNEETVEFYSQFAYIIQSTGSNFLTSFDVVFLDSDTVYYYTDDITDREARILKDQGLDISNLTDEEIKEIAEKKSDLFDDLYDEFEKQGISVTIDRSTGEIAMDSSVLFGGDSAVVTDEGKALLNKFLSAYSSIIYNEKYDGFIAKTVVEGHTAPVPGSTYEGDLPLSEARANNVIEYCVSADSGMDNSELTATLEAVGLSISKPVYGADGEIDMDACRRVSFRFIINIGA